MKSLVSYIIYLYNACNYTRMDSVFCTLIIQTIQGQVEVLRVFLNYFYFLFHKFEF